MFCINRLRNLVLILGFLVGLNFFLGGCGRDAPLEPEEGSEIVTNQNTSSVQKTRTSKPDAQDLDTPEPIQKPSVPPKELTVVSVSPNTGDRRIPDTMTIEIIFSEEINPETLTEMTFTVVDEKGQAVLGKITVDSKQRNATFEPKEHLASGMTYTVTLSDKITGLKGNSLKEPFSWTFTTDGSRYFSLKNGTIWRYEKKNKVILNPEKKELITLSLFSPGPGKYALIDKQGNPLGAFKYFADISAGELYYMSAIPEKEKWRFAPLVANAGNLVWPIREGGEVRLGTFLFKKGEIYRVLNTYGHTIKTPAGTFTNCQKVELNDPAAIGLLNIEAYYAPWIGLVFQKETLGLGHAVTTWTLTEFKQGK